MAVYSAATLFAKDNIARERILLDKPWKFALGHATDRNKDFNHATGEAGVIRLGARSDGLKESLLEIAAGSSL